jgi:hypothetical protein
MPSGGGQTGKLASDGRLSRSLPGTDDRDSRDGKGRFGHVDPRWLAHDRADRQRYRGRGAT